MLKNLKWDSLIYVCVYSENKSQQVSVIVTEMRKVQFISRIQLYVKDSTLNNGCIFCNECQNVLHSFERQM